MKLNLKQLENGRDAATNKDTIDNRDKALIIKQEIEKMKIRKVICCDSQMLSKCLLWTKLN